jgi:hypothetical protein
MTQYRIGIIAGALLAGGLLIALAGTAVAQGPTRSSDPGSSGAPGWMDGRGMMGGGWPGGMMGGERDSSTDPGVMDGDDSHMMDVDDMQTMHDWMDQVNPQLKALHDAMEKNGCDPDAMREFFASPSASPAP